MKHNKWSYTLALFLAFSILSACSGKEVVTEAAESQSTTESIQAEEAFESMVCFLNVGKADAAILASRGQYYLLDTGTEESAPALMGALHHLNIDKLSGVILTHSHKDHVGGMDALLANISVDKVLCPALGAGEKRFQKIQEQCQEKNVEFEVLSAGDIISFGAMNCRVLAPLATAVDENDQSLVIMAEVSEKKVLLMGDAQFTEENTLLSVGVDLKADLLKVGNHGNADATGLAFAKAVSPAWAVISTDTAEDHNSANERVQAALKDALIKLTQTTDIGYCFRFGSFGSMDMQEMKRSSKDDAVVIESLDIGNQTITLANRSEHDVDLSDWMVFEKKGSQLFCFPEGTQISKGHCITLAAKGISGNYHWPEDKIWKKKNESAELYDPYGNLMDQKSAAAE